MCFSADILVQHNVELRFLVTSAHSTAMDLARKCKSCGGPRTEKRYEWCMDCCKNMRIEEQNRKQQVHREARAKYKAKGLHWPGDKHINYYPDIDKQPKTSEPEPKKRESEWEPRPEKEKLRKTGKDWGAASSWSSDSWTQWSGWRSAASCPDAERTDFADARNTECSSAYEVLDDFVQEFGRSDYWQER